MKFQISHSEMKRENMLYYVHCAVQFNEEEKAIIRTRQLFDNWLEFKHGVVDYREGGELKPWHFLLIAIGFFVFGAITMRLSIVFGAVCWVGAALSVFAANDEEEPDPEPTRLVTIRTLMQRSFSVCGFNDPRVLPVIETEVIGLMEQLKTFFTDATAFPSPKEFEVSARPNGLGSDAVVLKVEPSEPLHDLRHEQMRIDAEIKALYDSLKARPIATLTDDEIKTRVTHRIMTYEDVVRNERFPASSLWHEFLRAVPILYSQESTFALQAPDYADDIGRARYLDYLRTFSVRSENAGDALETFVNMLAQSFILFVKSLPEVAFSTNHQGVDLPAFATVSLKSIIADLPLSISSIAYPFSSSDPTEKGLFTRLVAQTSGVFEPPPMADFKGSQSQLIKKYLSGSPFVDIFETSVPFDIPTASLLEHTLLVAGSGYGKTQTLDAIVARFLREEDPPALVVVDSTGALTKRIQTLAVFNGRLKDRIVIIDPEHEPGPALNMFDISNPRFRSYSPKQQASVQAELVELFKYMFSSIENPLTDPMKTALSYLVRLLLIIPKANITTLRNVLEHNPKGGYDAHPLKPHMEKLDATARDFFKLQYFTERVSGTRASLLQRLSSLISLEPFERMFTTVNKLDMFEELNKGSIILVNTNENILKDSSTLFGRYIISRTLAAAFERSPIPEAQRRPAFLIIDEAAPYFDDSFDKLLTRVRQFKLGVCVAFQHMQQTSEKLRSAIASCTAVKLAGGLASTDDRWLAHEIGTAPEFIKAQKKDSSIPPKWTQLACYVRNSQKAVSIQVPFYQLAGMVRMSEAAHRDLLARNRRRISNVADDEEPAPSMAMPPAVPTDNRSVGLQSRSDGHVYVDVLVNGVPIRMLVDTGATDVCLKRQDAEKVGFDIDALSFSGRARTPTGDVRYAPIIIKSLRIDRYELRDVEASVLQTVGNSLLGQSFLRRLESYHVTDGVLTLKWREAAEQSPSDDDSSPSPQWE